MSLKALGSSLLGQNPLGVLWSIQDSIVKEQAGAHNEYKNQGVEVEVPMQIIAYNGKGYVYWSSNSTFTGQVLIYEHVTDTELLVHLHIWCGINGNCPKTNRHGTDCAFVCVWIPVAKTEILFYSILPLQNSSLICLWFPIGHLSTEVFYDLCCKCFIAVIRLWLYVFPMPPLPVIISAHSTGCVCMTPTDLSHYL